MGGTINGGKQAAKTNKALYGDDWYRILGAKGGKISKGGGFSTMPRHKVIEAGRKGGLVSKRGALTDDQKRKQSESMKAKWAERKEQAAKLSRKYQ